MRLSRQEDWSGLPFPSPGDLPDPEIEPMSLALKADALPLSHQGSPQICVTNTLNIPVEKVNNLHGHIENFLRKRKMEMLEIKI